MLPSYEDITSRIPEPPTWWSSQGVPRYVEFTPKHASSIYADEVALLLIACQGCGTYYNVELSWSRFDTVHVIGSSRRMPSITELITTKMIHYGDPPRGGCCGAGPTMNSIPVKVLQFWKKENHTWVRDPSLEIEIEDPEDYMGDGSWMVG
jgi:hypothetical protein